MNLYIQMGHQMSNICKDLCEYWQGATVIISPQNIYPTEKLPVFATSLKELNGKILLDPQLYSPRKQHKYLQQHTYWPQSGVTSLELGDCRELITALANINSEIGSEAFILPSFIANKIDNFWGGVQVAIVNQARQIANDQKLMMTVALGKDVLNEDAQVESIIQYANQWEVEGVYIVCEHPERYYLVDKPIWVANLLSLVAGIKRQNKTVVVGYANHQMLPLALANCDAIAAGNFLNVRWFQPEHFETIKSDGKSRRTTWYYCPQALSEYKITFLDVAKRNDILSTIAPPPLMENAYSKVLFGGAMPSSTDYKEGMSVKHYLHCLKVQCELSSKPAYEETRDALFAQLETAAHIINGLHNYKINGQGRDFSEIVDVNEAAIQIFDKEFGFAMSQEWKA
jgi:hypothetical protein